MHGTDHRFTDHTILLKTSPAGSSSCDSWEEVWKEEFNWQEPSVLQLDIDNSLCYFIFFLFILFFCLFGVNVSHTMAN